MTYARRAVQLVLAPALLSVGCHPVRVTTIPSGQPLAAIVTWNTNGGSGDLPRLVADLESRRFAGQPSEACVLLLQESAAADLQAVAEPRGWTSAFVPVRAGGTQIRGNAIVSSVALRDARVLPLLRERLPRAAVVARIALGGHRLFVASVHLENRASWWKGGLLGDTARSHQVAGLLRALPADEPGILGGDFNTWLGPAEPAWRALIGRFTATPAWPRAPTFGNRLALDHVLMDLPEGWRATSWVLPDDYGSDHHPVMAVVFR